MNCSWLLLEHLNDKINRKVHITEDNTNTCYQGWTSTLFANMKKNPNQTNITTTPGYKPRPNAAGIHLNLSSEPKTELHENM